MANENEFPKVNGDIYYAGDANSSYYQGTLSATLNYGNVSVGTSATQIIASNTSRKSLLIRNNGGTDVYIGDSSVTTTNGFIVPAHNSIYLLNTDSVYGICSTGTIDIRYLEAQ